MPPDYKMTFSISQRIMGQKIYKSGSPIPFPRCNFQTHTRDNICIESLTGKSSHLFFLLPIGFLRRQKHKYKRLPIRPVFRWKFKYPNEQRQCRNIGARQYRCRRLSASRPTKKQNYKVNPNDTVWSFRGNNTYILPLSLDGYMNNPQEIGGLYIKGIVFYNP